MHDYPKEGSSTMVPFDKSKPPHPNLRYRNNNRPSNRLSNATDISDSGNNTMTRKDLESFVSQIISSFTPTPPPQAEYQILSATSKKQDLPLLSSLPQGAPVCSPANMLPSKPGTYQILDKPNVKGESKS